MNYRRLHKTSYVYLKRSIYWRSNSQPYLSGDVFADNSDVSFYSPALRGKHPDSRSIRDARVIFCPSHRLEDLLSDYGSMLNAKILILGNSDRDFNDFEFRLPKSLNAVFAQNLNVTDKHLHLLPIGIENRRLGVNGTPWLFGEKLCERTKNTKILVGPFSFTHAERLEFQFLRNNDQITIVEKRMTSLSYSRLASGYQYVAAPRGNGLDTHRFWEAAYRGSMPLVKPTPWSRMVRELNIPLIEVNDYSEQSLLQILNDSRFEEFSPKNIKALWWPFWSDILRKFI